MFYTYLRRRASRDRVYKHGGNGGQTEDVFAGFVGRLPPRAFVSGVLVGGKGCPRGRTRVGRGAPRKL